MSAGPDIVCRRIRVRGQVQGVGFRPHVWRLAHELALAGWVRNDGDGVEIEAQGAPAAVDALLDRLQRQAPPLARIASILALDAPQGPAKGFVIAPSRAGAATTAVTPDTAVCGACLAEMFDPADRRWRYPFINCTHCGPRYTITRALPYDRPHTAMAGFTLCPRCRAEYESPEDRRFHAQPNACPLCGPRLRLFDADGAPMAGDADPLAAAVERLQRGEIVAVKSLGGWHLACDARNAAAVARLRERKAREEKPFALMLANVASITPLAAFGAAERERLESPERPIVLLRKRAGCDAALPGIAPGLAWLGVMLPVAPLHWLMFHEAAGRPAGTGWTAEPQSAAWVMTSANPGGEPIVRDDDEALGRLAGIADAWLGHDRPIVNRCDDSVMRIAATAVGRSSGSASQFIRRARGYTPRAIRMPRAGPSVLATGAGLKSTACFTRGDEAFVTAHLGDLANAATCRAFDEAVARLGDLLQIEPTVVACDAHPDLYSTRFAAAYAHRRGLPLVSVQHHHAHIAALAAEHRLDRPLLGLALDGVGLGPDGAPWGGELLRLDFGRMRRLGHLAPLRLPGGDRAAREPWRMAAAALHRIGRRQEIARRFAAQPAAAGIGVMLDRGLSAPWTTSAGRWFDAAAGLLGVRAVAAYEGQAAMLLEGLAEQHGPAPAQPGGWFLGDDGTLDLTPSVASLADATDVPRTAAVFHATLAAGLAAWALRAARAERLRDVALGGGCWLNRVLADAVRQRLQAEGLRVLEAREAPPNDGAISLGQAWVAIEQTGGASPPRKEN